MPGPGGFLLADDATQARLKEFDDWVQEQERTAQQTLSSAATTAGNAVTGAAQAVQQAPNAALQQYDQWRAQQDQQALAQQAAQTTTSAQPSTSTLAVQPPASIAPAAPAAPSTAPTEGSASTPGPTPLEQFDQWRQQFDQNAQKLTTGAGQAASNVGTAASQATTNVADQGAKMVDSAVSTAGGAAEAVMGTSQFGDSQLTAAEAYAACGPAAAVRFAQAYGRNPTLREATDLARSVGWNEANGMAGIGSEKLLMDKLGIPTKQVGADWSAIANEAQTGNPVTISTPGHYFFADAYDPNSGAFHVGRSGLDLKGGSEWMTPDQMEQRMGRLQGALFADNPNVPAASGGAQSTPASAGAAGGPPSGAIDSSSPQAFAKSVAPYAAYAAQALGIDPTWVASMMASESNYGKAPGNELFGVKALPGQKGTTLQTHEGEYGGTTQNATFAAYDTPLDSVNAWIDLIKNHYKNAVGATDLGTFVHGLKSGGYFTAAEDEYRNILQSIQGRIGGGVQDAINAAGGAAQAAGSTVQATASNAGQQAVDAATNLAQNSQSTLSRAGDLVSSTGQQLQDLRDKSTQGINDLQALLDKQQKDWDTFAQQQQAERDAWKQQMDAQTASIQAGASKAAQNAMDLASGAGQAGVQQLQDLGTSIGTNPALQPRASGLADTGVGQVVRGVLQPPDTAVIESASPTAVDNARRALRIAGIANPSDAELARAIQGGQLGAGASAGQEVSGVARTVVASDAPIVQRVLEGIIRPGTNMDDVVRWAQGDTQDIARDLANSPMGRLLRDEHGTLDLDKAQRVAEAVKDRVTRMYHGTGAEFDQPNPQRMDPEGLYGPGYYMTSNPDVAGGQVAAGGEQVGPSWLVSNVKRAAGDVISPGYAQAGADSYTALQADLRDVQTRLADPSISGRMRGMLEGRQQDLQAQIDAYNPASGPNVRALDLPNVTNEPKPLPEMGQPFAESPNTHLFDIEAPVSEQTARQLVDVASGEPAARSWDPQRLADQVNDWTGRSGQQIYDDLVTLTGSKMDANQVLQAAGFDGLTHTGGRVTGTAPHDVAVVFPESLDKVRNAISGRQGGAAGTGFSLRLGGAAAGVASQETGPTGMTDQEKQDPWGRLGRDVAAGVLGSAAPGTALALAQRAGPSYADIAGLRPGVTHLPGVAQTPAQLFSSYTKQNLLTGPKTQITNILTQLAELARNPVSAAAGGRDDEAIAGLKTAAQALPDAFSNFAKTLTSGQTQMTGGTGATSKYLPIFRMLSATDDFFRTLGWAMGAGMEGQRFLRENPGAVPSAVLSSNRGAIDAAGQKMGSMSVFGEGKGIAGGFSDFKNRLLSSASGKDQVMGLLWDALVPFSGVPDRIWNIGIKRTPGVGELEALSRAGFKFAKGDVRGAQQAVGDALQQSVVSAAILSNVANGNIRGPDDPEHPSGIKLGGQWYDYSSWGPWVLPMAVPAAIYESVRTTGNKPNAGVAEQITGAGNSLLKVLANQSYAGDLIKTLSQVGEGNGLGAVGNTALSYTDRLLPAAGALNNAAAIYDPILRDTTRDNPLQTVLARLQSKVPGLEQQLPATPVMTSGKPQERQSSGVGSLVGMQTRPESPLELQIADLERKNYRINDPTKVPTEVSLGGSTIKLTDAEQRAIAEQRGKMIDNALAGQTGSPTWRGMSDEQKALTLNAILSSLDSQNAALFAQMTAPAELQRRIEQGRTVAGKLQPAGSR